MDVTRQEFLYFSLWEKALFYVLAAVAVGALVWQIVQRARVWREGRPVGPTAKNWVRNIAVFVLGQRKVRAARKRSGAPMHLAIFYGFLAMLLATSLLAVNTYGPVNFHHGNYYLAFEALFDTLGLLLLVGLIWALALRLLDSRPRTKAPSDLWTLALLLTITITGYWLEAARISANPHAFDRWSWVGYAWAQAQGPFSPLAYKAVWWFHVVWILVFFAVLPRLRLRHVVLAILSIAGKPERPMGHLRPVSMEEVEQTEQVGVKLAKDYSRWHLLSLDACMECGRCTEVCPAWGVGKALNPKQVVQDIRSAGELPVVGRVSEEALWQCTTCHACVEACPVAIRHVDLIVDARRHLVSEGALSGTAATMLRQTASTGHAWGAAAADREKWMEGLDIPLCRNGVEFEFLFWVGCAGATDPGAIKTTKAVAALLRKGGVRFACLGREEACTGDPARRVGEEFLFQEKAALNVAAFEKYGVKKVVTACPHCLNTLRHEYGDFGASLEVLHHSQLLSGLVSKGALLAAKRPEVVFHDPCYLARVNDESDAPHGIVTDMREPVNHGRKTLCCGAGGGRMWMDEPADQRPANRRTEELLATGAKTIAVACPFCRIMLEGSVPLVDIAEMVLEANG